MIKFLEILIFVFLFLYVITFVYASKYSNPYKLIIIFGKKGVGKSADIVKRSLRYKKQGYRCFCNDDTISTCEYYPSEDFGTFSDENSVIFLDEAGLVFHKRDFSDKSKSEALKNARVLSKMLRHQRCIVILYSQSFDIDLSLKENADILYYYKRVFNIFTIGRRISKSLVLTEPQADRPGAMMDSYSFDSLFSRGSFIINFIPKYTKYYNSFFKMDLPTYNEKYPDRVELACSDGASENADQEILVDNISD